MYPIDWKTEHTVKNRSATIKGKNIDDTRLPKLTRRSIVIDRVLSRELLEEENDKRNNEPNPIARRKERLSPTQTSTSLTILSNRRFNFSQFFNETLICDGTTAEEGEVAERFGFTTLHHEPTG